MNKKILLALLFFVHFFFIVVYNLRQSVALSFTRQTYLAKKINAKYLHKADYFLSALLLQKKYRSPDNNYLTLYMTLTGAKTPLTYFVSNISPAEKIVFELNFTDGSTQVILPAVESNEMGIRFKCLYYQIMTTADESYRDMLVKKLTAYETKEYANIKTIKVVFGLVDIPSINDFLTRQSLSYRYLYQYNFRINQ